jgi:hypothetical protein
MAMVAARARITGTDHVGSALTSTLLAALELGREGELAPEQHAADRQARM